MPVNQTKDCPDVENLLVELSYEGDQSPDFDYLIQRRGHTYARTKNQSEATKDKIIISEWHVPCHCILTQKEDGMSQAFHVQPNQLSYTLLSFDQEKALKEIGAEKNSNSIAIFSKRSWYGHADHRELQKFGFSDIQEISVDTDQWWRVLYDPIANEVWVDDKIHRKLLKYRGFLQKEKIEVAEISIQRHKMDFKKILS